MRLPAVFIASTTETLDFAKSLGYAISNNADVTIWTEGILNSSISATESLTKIAERTDLAIFLLGPDDLSNNHSERYQYSWQNIIFEIGLFLGKLGSSRVILAIAKNTRFKIPTDLGGLMYHEIKGLGTINAEIELSLVVKKALNQLDKIDGLSKKNIDKNMQFYSCFISYSAKDSAFVNLLYKDLTEIGVPCWLDSMEMRIGDDLNSSINRSLQEQDRMILILSQHSIASKWINKELSVSLELERLRRKTILFPIRIDDSIFKKSLIQPLKSITNRHIGDFTKWHNENDYKKSFSHMVRDLMTVSSAESKEGV